MQLPWILPGSSSALGRWEPHLAASGRAGQGSGLPLGTLGTAGAARPRLPAGIHCSQPGAAPGVPTGSAFGAGCPSPAPGCSNLPRRFPNPKPLCHSKPQEIKAASREAQQGPPKRSRALRSSVPGDVLLYPPEVQRVSLVDRQADDFGDFKGVDGSKVGTEEQSRSRPRRRLRAPGPAPRPPRFKAPAAAFGHGGILL